MSAECGDSAEGAIRRTASWAGVPFKPITVAENSLLWQYDTNSRRLIITAQTAGQVDDSFNKYSRSIFYVSGAVLNSGYMAMKKTDKYLCPCTSNIQERSIISVQGATFLSSFFEELGDTTEKRLAVNTNSRTSPNIWPSDAFQSSSTCWPGTLPQELFLELAKDVDICKCKYPFQGPRLILGPFAQEEINWETYSLKGFVTGSGIVPEIIYFQNRNGGTMLPKKGWWVPGGIWGSHSFIHSLIQFSSYWPRAWDVPGSEEMRELRKLSFQQAPDNNQANNLRFQGVVSPTKKIK